MTDTPNRSCSVILLADDDPNVRHLLKVLLIRAGYKVMEACDGDSALALAQQAAWAFDLLLTDIRMPGMDGYALGKAVRQELADVPVIYVSGFTEKPDVHVLNDPAQKIAFIPKPFLPKALLDTVSSMLSTAKTTRQSGQNTLV
jgi:CheY-like chemotaxis protein